MTKWLKFLLKNNRWLKAEGLDIFEEYFIDFDEKYLEKLSPDNLYREKQFQQKKAIE